MATSYNCTIKIPTASTWNNGSYTVYNQITFATGSGGLVPMLDGIVDLFDIYLYQGTTTYTQQQIGSYIYITFKTRNLQINPTVINDELVSISLYDDNFAPFSGAWESIEVCNDCYELNIDNCEDAFSLTGLNATTNYKLVFTDNQSNVNYTYYAQSDGQGLINIDATYFPDGVFNPYSSYTVSIFDNNGNPMVLSLDAVEYDCYRLTFTPNTIVFD